MTENETSRRNVVYGIAAAGVAVPVLAACGSSGTSNGDVTGTAKSPGSGAVSPSGGGIRTSEIPVGGGKIFPGREIVVTQPTAGVFKAFSAICTHQGCQVTQIADGTIDCPCHGSTFSIVDGSVQGGQATSPLPEKTVTSNGTTLTVS